MRPSDRISEVIRGVDLDDPGVALTAGALQVLGPMLDSLEPDTLEEALLQGIEWALTLMPDHERPALERLVHHLQTRSGTPELPSGDPT